MSAILEINGLTQSYNNAPPAVSNLSLSVQEGEIFGFIGHNGAGKSTTIKSIVGILPVKADAVKICGMSISSDRRACQRLCAYVPDNPDIYGFMTGIGYINFVADIFQVEESVRSERIARYGDMFEITSRLGDVIDSYSHGMKQKIALIAAFVHEPKLLVLDEPFVGLDPKATAAVKTAMRQLCERGSAIFFSTHVLDVAERLCDRVGMIDHGVLIAEGAVSELIGKGTLEELFLERLEEQAEKNNG